MAEVIKDIGELLPNAQTACRTFLAECEKQGLKVCITETYRTQQRQNELYAQGRTTSGNIVTWTKNSVHTKRRAWDICQNVKGQEYSNLSFFNSCGEIAESLGITWGGRWSTPDRPHFEVKADWTLPEKYMEEIDMEELKALQETVSKLNDRVYELEKQNAIYNYIDENMPEFAKPTISKLCAKGILKGDENGLNLNYVMMRILVLLDRVGVFGE